MKRLPFVVLAVVALVAGLWSAFGLRWLSDDIFITLRYVQNWLAGNGIVYNVGEYVEGYTHFLWLCLIALLQLLGGKPEAVVQYAGIASYAGVVALFVLISWRLKSPVPLTGILLSLNYDFKVWATGGLETMFFTLLVSASLFTLSFWTTNRSAVVGGLLLTLAVFTRPDGILFLLVAGVFVLIRSGRRALLHFALPFGVLYVPYLVWKYLYYGNLLPNVYYAKSGGGLYFNQGFFYVWTYFTAYFSSWVLLLGIYYVVVKKSFRNLAEPPHAVVVLALSYLIVYGLLFVARVGGDFMYARFLVPLIPLMYVVGEIALWSLTANRKWLAWAVAVLLLIAVVGDKERRDSLFEDKNSTALRGIADERWYWTQTELLGTDFISFSRLVGTELNRYFRDEHIRVLLRGQASLGYYGNFAECIENAGLTDEYIAHLPIKARSRPGHEKRAPRDYISARRVHFFFFRAAYDSTISRRVYFRVPNGYICGEVFTYDPELMARLKKRFPDDILFRPENQTQ